MAIKASTKPPSVTALASFLKRSATPDTMLSVAELCKRALEHGGNRVNLFTVSDKTLVTSVQSYVSSIFLCFGIGDGSMYGDFDRAVEAIERLCLATPGLRFGQAIENLRAKAEETHVGLGNRSIVQLVTELSS